MHVVRFTEPDLIVLEPCHHTVGHVEDPHQVGGRREIVGGRHLDVETNHRIGLRVRVA